jgi:hypothetical protein
MRSRRIYRAKFRHWAHDDFIRADRYVRRSAVCPERHNRPKVSAEVPQKRNQLGGNLCLAAPAVEDQV